MLGLFKKIDMEVSDFFNELNKVTKPNETYVLFGDDACSEYEINGVDGVINKYEQNELGYEVKLFTDESTVAEILYQSQGFYDFCLITKDEYNKLK